MPQIARRRAPAAAVSDAAGNTFTASGTAVTAYAVLDEGAGTQTQPASRTLRLGVAGLGVASTLFLPGVEEFPQARIVVS